MIIFEKQNIHVNLTGSTRFDPEVSDKKQVQEKWTGCIRRVCPDDLFH